MNSEHIETLTIQYTSYVELKNRVQIVADDCEQIGFLTEWQMYAQKLEGDEWIGEKMEPGKIDKMSGISSFLITMLWLLIGIRSTTGTVV